MIIVYKNREMWYDYQLVSNYPVKYKCLTNITPDWCVCRRRIHYCFLNCKYTFVYYWYYTEQIVYLIKLDIISLKYDPKFFIFIWPRFFLTKMCWLYPLLHVKRCIAFHWPIYNLNRNWNKQNNIMACIVSKLLLYFE